MRVLVLGWEYPPAVAGGLGAACHGLTSALSARGHQVQLALPDTCRPFGEASSETIYLDTGAAERERGGEVGNGFHPYATDAVLTRQRGGAAEAAASSAAGWGAAGASLYGGHLEAAVRRMTASAVDTLAGLDFDVIHAHDWMTFPAALRVRLASRRPAVLHVHSTAFDRGGSRMVGGQLGIERGTIASVERAGVRTADATCAVSSYTRSVLIEHYGADAERVHVVPNAPSAADARALSSECSAGSSHGTAFSLADDAPPTVLFLGRLTRQKGVGFFLRAAALVLADHRDARFLIAGSGEERAALIEAAAELGIARRVFFLGAISEEAKRDAYRSADVFVLPSVSEPFGLTPLEALAQGTPVVLTRTCGVAEFLPSAPAVEPWDAAAMASEISSILASRTERDGRAAQLVAAGRRESSLLSWDRSAAALERALIAAVGQGAQDGREPRPTAAPAEAGAYTHGQVAFSRPAPEPSSSLEPSEGATESR